MSNGMNHNDDRSRDGFRSRRESIHRYPKDGRNGNYSPACHASLSNRSCSSLCHTCRQPGHANNESCQKSSQFPETQIKSSFDDAQFSDRPRESSLTDIADQLANNSSLNSVVCFWCGCTDHKAEVCPWREPNMEISTSEVLVTRDVKSNELGGGSADCPPPDPRREFDPGVNCEAAPGRDTDMMISPDGVPSSPKPPSVKHEETFVKPPPQIINRIKEENFLIPTPSIEEDGSKEILADLDPSLPPMNRTSEQETKEFPPELGSLTENFGKEALNHKPKDVKWEHGNNDVPGTGSKVSRQTARKCVAGREDDAVKSRWMKMKKRVRQVMAGHVLEAGREMEIVSSVLSSSAKSVINNLEQEILKRVSAQAAMENIREASRIDSILASMDHQEKPFGILSPLDSANPILDPLATWTLRGGNWMLVGDPELVPPGQHESERVEPVKKVLYGGRQLSEVNENLIDPRAGVVAAVNGQAMKLELPLFAKSFLGNHSASCPSEPSRDPSVNVPSATKGKNAEMLTLSKAKPKSEASGYCQVKKRVSPIRKMDILVPDKALKQDSVAKKVKGGDSGNVLNGKEGENGKAPGSALKFVKVECPGSGTLWKKVDPRLKRHSSENGLTAGSNGKVPKSRKLDFRKRKECSSDSHGLRREGKKVRVKREEEEAEIESETDSENSEGGSSQNMLLESEGEESAESDGSDMSNFEYQKESASSHPNPRRDPEPHLSKRKEEKEIDSHEEEAMESVAESWKKRPREYTEKMRTWGNKMSKAAMVPPVTRTYELIDDYVIVTDEKRVKEKLIVDHSSAMDDDLNRRNGARAEYFVTKLQSDWPDERHLEPRLTVGRDVVEQEVYGIDPMTHNQLLDCMTVMWHVRGPQASLLPASDDAILSEEQQHAFVEEQILTTLNRVGQSFTGKKAPMELDLVPVVRTLLADMERENHSHQTTCRLLLQEMEFRQKNWHDFKFRAYRKGLGVVCTRKSGLRKKNFVVEFIGEIYPPWRWFEKQDGIRKIQNKESVAEFYNILLERPRKDGGGFDILVVDAMHKANFASRICHSCHPNCEVRVVAVNSKYMIGVFALRDIRFGEELTFDYASITESQEEYNQAVCLCGNRFCKGSYLSLGGCAHLQHVMNNQHGFLTRSSLLLEACTSDKITPQDHEHLNSSGIGSCLLSNLPDWAIRYAARIAKFINQERKLLPDIILKQSSRTAGRTSRRRFVESPSEDEADGMEGELAMKQYARNEADGIFMNRLQNLAITMDKVRYCLSKMYAGGIRNSPSPIRLVSAKELWQKLWKEEGSVVSSLLNGMKVHLEKKQFKDFLRKVQQNTPESSREDLKQSLLWLRDELATMTPSASCRFDAAADLIHLYAYTETWFTHRVYQMVESPPVSIFSSDLGRSTGESDGELDEWEWSKRYDRDYVLGQLMFWYEQTRLEPGKALLPARRGCLVLPDPSSCFSNSKTQLIPRAYGTRERNAMLERMEKKVERCWPKTSEESIWEFQNSRPVYGSPIMDAIFRGQPVNEEMMDWLRSRPVQFTGPYDMDQRMGL